jgi:hypothetical protein
LIHCARKEPRLYCVESSVFFNLIAGDNWGGVTVLDTGFCAYPFTKRKSAMTHIVFFIILF